MILWEPKANTPDPAGIHRECGGLAVWTEPHYTGYPEPDCCCSWIHCQKCGEDFTQCSGNWIETKEASK